jgi:AcrR family transcriptional regulator
MPPAGAHRTAPRAQRADARRNIAAILDAATDCLARDPEMSIADIAAAAGVGRITLYGHFKTRAELVDAVLVRTIKHADAILDATDTVHDPILRRVQSLIQRGTHKDARAPRPIARPHRLTRRFQARYRHWQRGRAG